MRNSDLVIKKISYTLSLIGFFLFNEISLSISLFCCCTFAFANSLFIFFISVTSSSGVNDVFIESSTGANNAGVSDDLSIAKIDTIAKSRSQYSARDQNKADVVRRFQQVAGFPSNATMIHAMLSNSIKNSPITKRDIELTAKMLGPSKYSLQGKRTARTPDAIDGHLQVVPVPDIIVTLSYVLMLCSSMMFLSYHHYRNIFILVLLMPLIIFRHQYRGIRLLT